MKAFSDFPVPTCKRQLMRFLGMAGYYRKFCDNFSVIAEPLTNLLSKRTKFIWTNDCQKAFDILKAILKNEPDLLAPNFAKEFKLAVDASDTGAGSVLMQEDVMRWIIRLVTFPKSLTNIKIIIRQFRKNVCPSFLLFSILKFI